MLSISDSYQGDHLPHPIQINDQSIICMYLIIIICVYNRLIIYWLDSINPIQLQFPWANQSAKFNNSCFTFNASPTQNRCDFQLYWFILGERKIQWICHICNYSEFMLRWKPLVFRLPLNVIDRYIVIWLWNRPWWRTQNKPIEVKSNECGEWRQNDVLFVDNSHAKCNMVCACTLFQCNANKNFIVPINQYVKSERKCALLWWISNDPNLAINMIFVLFGYCFFFLVISLCFCCQIDHFRMASIAHFLQVSLGVPSSSPISSTPSLSMLFPGLSSTVIVLLGILFNVFLYDLIVLFDWFSMWQWARATNPIECLNMRDKRHTNQIEHWKWEKRCINIERWWWMRKSNNFKSIFNGHEQ